jgi:hypothetical protein
MKLVSLRIACFCVLLLLLCLTSYSYASIHVLSIGDWPHDTLSPTYSDVWIQTGWAPSLGVVPVDSLSRFDAVVCDSSVTGYVNQEPWNDVFDGYVKNGGTLVLMVSKNASSSGEILKETVLGNGRILEVVGGSSAAFWEDLYKSSICYLRFFFIQFLMVMILVVTGVLVIQLTFFLCRKPKVMERESSVTSTGGGR